jgi:hypothetical protein
MHRELWIKMGGTGNLKEQEIVSMGLTQILMGTGNYNGQ